MRRRPLLTLPLGLLAGCASNPLASSRADTRGLVLSVREYRHPHSTVVLKNTGLAPVFLYTEANSWGFFALRAEFSKGSHIVSVSRKGSFTRNVPRSAPLAPGEKLVFDFILDDEHCFFDPPQIKSFAGWKLRWIYDTAPAVEPGYDAASDRVLPVHLATEWIDA